MIGHGAAVALRAARGSIFIALFGIAATRAGAGVIRHDREDADYLALANEPRYDAVGLVRATANGQSRVCTGTLIAPDWAITAAHCLDDVAPNGASYRNGDEILTSSEIYVHPLFTGSPTDGNDLALMRLAFPSAQFVPAQRMRDSIPLGATATIVGYGQTGTGHTGSQSGTHGTKRAGQNVVDANGTRVTGPGGRMLPEYLLFSDFDNPDVPDDSTWGSSTPLDLEYQTGPGDSGGGWFVDQEGRTRLYAVHSLATSFDESTNNDYGDVAAGSRVTRFNTWIDGRLEAVYWMNPAGGEFHEPENWSSLDAPPTDRSLRFAFPNAYAVQVSGDQQIAELQIDHGDVAFNVSNGVTQIGGAVVATGATAPITIDADAAVEFSGNFAGNVTKTGAGELQFAGTTNFAGRLMVQSGLLTAARTSDVELEQLEFGVGEAIDMELGEAANVRINDSLSLPTSAAIAVLDDALLQAPALAQDGELSLHGGQLLVDGDLTQGASAVTSIDLDGVIFDEPVTPIHASDSISLSGELRLDLDDVPIFDRPLSLLARQEWTLLSAAGDLHGAFSSVAWTSLPEGFEFSLVYEANAVVLEIDRMPSALFQVMGDTNGDGVVDLVDLNNVRSNFGASRGLGDTNGDLVIDLFDLNAVRNHFGEVAVDPRFVVPEPGSFALLMAGLTAIRIRRRARL
jgi:hypothetical protein